MTHLWKGRALIFIASDFDEAFVATCLTQLWENSISVGIVAASRSAVKGKAGLTVLPDLTTGDISQEALGREQHLLVFPGGQVCVSKVLTDPRVYALIDEALAHGGYVAAVEEAVRVLQAAGRPSEEVSGRFIKLVDHDPLAVIQRMIKILL